MTIPSRAMKNVNHLLMLFEEDKDQDSIALPVLLDLSDGMGFEDMNW